MRKFRSTLTISLIILVCVTAFLSILFAILTMKGQFLERDDMRYLMFGLAAGDVFLLILLMVALTTGFFFVMRAMMRPIVDLERAITKITEGDYNVKVSSNNRPNEMREMLENFNLMVEQLKNNEYLHKDFSSNISHEFKTPLAIIKGYADLLEEGNLTEEEQKQYAKYISRESKRLTALTANLLRISSLDNDKVYGKVGKFSLDEQIRQVVLDMETKWEEKDIEIDLELKEIYFHGEEELMNQVWFNLIDNAVKFTEPGGQITVTARKDIDKIIIKISDTGIGMDAETQKHIYEQFYRGKDSHKFEGNGLGLSLVQRIIALHEGRISVESMPNFGSTFTVELPVKNHR